MMEIDHSMPMTGVEPNQAEKSKGAVAQLESMFRDW